jgi:hypothetical protein
MAGRPGGAPAVFGLALLAILVGLLVTAVFWARSAAIPVSVAVCAALIALMLLTKPGTDDPTPDLTTTGRIGMAMTVCVLLLATVHAVHLVLANRRWSGRA